MTDHSPPNRISLWIQAARPKTLWAAFAPVLVGTAMAIDADAFHGPAALAALTFAVLIQIGTNFCNDYCDFKKGADTEDRQGPTRVTQAGLIRPEVVLRATVITFALALAVSAYLVFCRAGWPLAVIGVVSVLCGAWYTAGPYPLGYLGLGDIFVLVFFGPVAVAGTYYVQAVQLDPVVIVAGLGPGLLAVAILAVNNYRDMEEDKRSGKKTLAVRFGGRFAKLEYLACIVIALLIPAGIYLKTGDHLGALIVFILIPFAVPALRTMFTQTGGAALNPLLGRTAKLLLIYSILLAVGWVI